MDIKDLADNAPTARIADNVTRETLANGLTVLIKENHSAPVAALLAYVKVGYFHEPDKLNGAAHVIEHMLFKGTPRRPEDEQIAREVREIGGLLNAGTYYEETSYYLVAPSRHLETAMDIQADAFWNSTIDPAELAKEIEVIVQESQQKRDNPNAMLTESLYALAYDQHRIRRWRIGPPEILRALTHDDLITFFHATYRPENVVLTIVGDVDTTQALALANRYWGGAARGQVVLEESPSEPPRTGFRYQRMTGDTRQRLFQIGFPAPPLLHPDAAPLMILSALLSDGRSARLYRRLKEDLQIANSAWASYEAFARMGILTLGAECAGDDPLPVAQALWAEATRLQREPVEPEELARIRARVESRRLYAQEEVLGVARALASYEALGDYRLTDTLLERLRAVTADDIQRVARAYLQLPRAAMLEYLPAPTEPTAAPAAPEPAAVEAALRAASPEASTSVDGIMSDALDNDLLAPAEAFAPVSFHVVARPAEEPARDIALPHGGRLLFRARRDLPLVAFSVLFRGGRRHETAATSGLTNLMLKASLKGTRTRTAEAIANGIEGLGSGIGQSLTPDYFGYGMKIKKDALRAGFEIFADVLTGPTFPEAEVEREKQTIYADLRRQQDNNFSLAYDLFASAYYPSHPYGLPANGIAEAIAPLTPDDLAAWHRRYVAADNLVIGLAGDLDEDEAIALFRNLLPADPIAARQRADSEPGPFVEAVVPGEERALYRDKKQTAGVLGFRGANVANDDRHALDTLSEITSSMGGRFFRSVRGENALAYQVTSFHRARRDSGNFVAYTSTAPENEEKARALLLNDIAVLQNELVGAKELDAAKATILGEHVIGTQSFGAQAGELAGVGVYGLPIDEPQRYLDRVQAITAEDIRDVTRRYLPTDRYWVGVVRGGAKTDPEIAEAAKPD